MLRKCTLPATISCITSHLVSVELLWWSYPIMHYSTIIFKESVLSFIIRHVFNFFAFLEGPYLWHMEVPRLGVTWELQLLVYTTATATGIWTVSVTYTTAQSSTGFITHWTGPGIESASSWILVGFITTEPWQNSTLFCIYWQSFCPDSWCSFLNSFNHFSPSDS